MNDNEQSTTAFRKIWNKEREISEKHNYDVKLAITAWVFKHLCDHANEGGSFRYLIYDRLGFDSDAYATLYCAGGMTISNKLNLPTPTTNEGTEKEREEEKK